METEVFLHQLQKVMSIYVDDLLTWAQDIDELCQCKTLKKIFEAIRNKGLTLNPAKCEFGMEEMEVVGHLVDQHGVTFTADKLNQVAQRTLPVDKSSLKSFLGLGSFFRNHVENFATKSHALGELLLEYTKTSKKVIPWTEELKKQFYDLQAACRKLTYVDPNAPIRVYSDASDYGIGAYLWQVLPEGQDVQIEFISKTLTKVERRWSTYEKEMITACLYQKQS